MQHPCRDILNDVLSYLQATAAADQAWQAKLTAAGEQAAADKALLVTQHESALAAAKNRLEMLERQSKGAADLAGRDCEFQKVQYKSLSEDMQAANLQVADLTAWLGSAAAEQQALSSKHELVSRQLEAMQSICKDGHHQLAQEQLSNSAELRKLRAGLTEARQQAQHDAAAREAEKQQLMNEVSRLQQLQRDSWQHPAAASVEHPASTSAHAPTSQASRDEPVEGSAADKAAGARQGAPTETQSEAAAVSGSSPSKDVMDTDVDAIQVKSRSFQHMHYWCHTGT